MYYQYKKFCLHLSYRHIPGQVPSEHLHTQWSAWFTNTYSHRKHTAGKQLMNHHGKFDTNLQKFKEGKNLNISVWSPFMGQMKKCYCFNVTWNCRLKLQMWNFDKRCFHPVNVTNWTQTPIKNKRNAQVPFVQCWYNNLHNSVQSPPSLHVFRKTVIQLDGTCQQSQHYCDTTTKSARDVKKRDIANTICSSFFRLFHRSLNCCGATIDILWSSTTWNATESGRASADHRTVPVTAGRRTTGGGAKPLGLINVRRNAPCQTGTDPTLVFGTCYRFRWCTG